MKNLLVLIVAFAVFLHFYPQPKLENWFNAQKATVLAAFADATDTKVRLNPEKIYNDLQPNWAQFNVNEQKFVKEITASRQSVINFFKKNCQTKRQTPKLHQKNQQRVCQIISQYQSLF